ncbi:MAG: histidine kinase, partial [Lachnospiraceae bacterium]|nr:histidine kinase [Lachnospiraceae bacterium]
MRKLFQKFQRDLPIRTKFLVINISVIIITVLMSLIIIYRTSESVTANTLASQRNLVIQTSNALSATTETVLTVADSLSSQPFFYYLFSSGDEEDLEKYSDNFIQSLPRLVDGKIITSLRIYLSPDYEQVYDIYSDTGIFYPMSEIRSSYWRGIFSGKPFLNSLFCPNFYLTRRETSDCGDLAYIRKIGGSATSPACFIAVYFSSESLEEVLRQNLDDNKSVYYITNSRDNLVASSDSALAGLYYQSYEDIAADLPADAQFGRKTILNKDLYMSYRDLRDTDWRMAAVIPAAPLDTRGREDMLNQLFIFIVMAVILLILQMVMSLSLTKRLTEYSRKIHIRNNGILQKLPVKDDQDEIGQLGRTYNYMVDELEGLINRNTETAKKLRISEIQALQAQINPHFLYNMLDMINWLAIDGNQEGVSQAVRSLSKFYRLTLSNKNLLIPIKDELQHVSLYVLLQNMRYEDQVNFIVDIPNEIMDCSIPKLVLQPVVENALLHGIFEKESRKGTIVIMAWEDIDPDTGKEIIV